MPADVFGAAAIVAVAATGLQVLPTLGLGLLYQHGRYLPVWLPDLAMLAAYAAHVAWPLGGVVAVGIALTTGVGVALALHFGLFYGPSERGEALPLLLAGIGLGQVFQGLASLYGEGMSQHYPPIEWLTSVAFTTFGVPVRGADIASVAFAVAGAVSLALLLRYTRTGLRARAVLLNRDHATSLGLPVARIDVAIVGAAALLAVAGTVLRAARFDLQPGMMTQPGLSGIAALVTAGQGRYLTSLAVVFGIELLSALAGVVPSLSPLQRAIPYVVLGVVLVVRGMASRGQRSS